MTPKKIKKLRKALGLTQKEFACKLGVNISTLSRWETGKFKPHHVFVGWMMYCAKERGIKL